MLAATRAASDVSIAPSGTSNVCGRPERRLTFVTRATGCFAAGITFARAATGFTVSRRSVESFSVADFATAFAACGFAPLSIGVTSFGSGAFTATAAARAFATFATTTFSSATGATKAGFATTAFSATVGFALSTEDFFARTALVAGFFAAAAFGLATLVVALRFTVVVA